MPLWWTNIRCRGGKDGGAKQWFSTRVRWVWGQNRSDRCERSLQCMRECVIAKYSQQGGVQQPRACNQLHPQNKLPTCTFALPLVNDKMSKVKNGSLSGFDHLERPLLIILPLEATLGVLKPRFMCGCLWSSSSQEPCWCLCPELPQKGIWMFLVWATAWGYPDIHRPGFH